MQVCGFLGDFAQFMSCHAKEMSPFYQIPFVSNLISELQKLGGSHEEGANYAYQQIKAMMDLAK